MKLLNACTCKEPDGWTNDLLNAWRRERGINSSSEETLFWATKQFSTYIVLHKFDLKVTNPKFQGMLTSISA